jgi:hypothetical protein
VAGSVGSACQPVRGGEPLYQFSANRNTISSAIDATASSGTVGKKRCTFRISRTRTVASPIPASKSRSAGGVGCNLLTTSDARAATTAFSLHVFTKARYFCRLS